MTQRNGPTITDKGFDEFRLQCRESQRKTMCAAGLGLSSDFGDAMADAGAWLNWILVKDMCMSDRAAKTIVYNTLAAMMTKATNRGESSLDIWATVGDVLCLWSRETVARIQKRLEAIPGATVDSMAIRAAHVKENSLCQRN